MKIRFILWMSFFLSTYSFAATNDFVHHPTPKEPVYLSEGIYKLIKSSVPQPPSIESGDQKNDEAELFKLQTSRTPADCKQAKTEILVSLESFYGAPRGPLDSDSIKKLNTFFEQIRNDGDFFIQKMKKDFPRQRPFAYIKGLNPCVSKEVTGAYPSGHATLSRLYALILSDLYPSQRSQLEKRAAQIGLHRVLSGMHHPSDIAAGKTLGEVIFKELKKSEKYQQDFKRLQQTVASNG